MGKPVTGKTVDPYVVPGLSPGEVAPMMKGGVAVDHRGRPLTVKGWAKERVRAKERDLLTAKAGRR